jgi:hypothetical protein
MDITPLLSHLARLRTAAARFCEYARAEAYALAEAGENAASLNSTARQTSWTTSPMT